MHKVEGNMVWSQEEVVYLRNTYIQEGVVGFKRKYSNRTDVSIRHKANCLGLYCSRDYLVKIRNNPYTINELNILKKFYPIGGANACIRFGLKRPVMGIHSKASELCVSSGWNELEIDILKEFYPNGGVLSVIKKLPHRSKRSIGAMAQKLGVLYEGDMCSEYNRKKMSEMRLGSNNPAWRGGIGRLPYHYSFNNGFKDIVREMFSYRCVNCGEHQSDLSEKLSVHHIYNNKLDKTNIEEYVPLCCSCHGILFGVENEMIPYFEYLVEVIIDEQN